MITFTSTFAAMALAISTWAPSPVGHISDPKTPRLELTTAASSVVNESVNGLVLLNLGAYIASREAPFELRLKRNSYNDPVKIYQILHRGPREIPKEVDEIAVNDF